jgi:hypothetical protein
MSNPYQSPVVSDQGASDVQAPAVALIVVALIAIVLGGIGLLFDCFLLFSGAIESLEAANRRPISRTASVQIRMAWGILLLAASSFVLFGAIKMMNRSNFGLARAAAIVAMIPLVGPCCLLGIPFGIWALTVLNRPEIRASFQSQNPKHLNTSH